MKRTVLSIHYLSTRAHGAERRAQEIHHGSCAPRPGHCPLIR